MASREDMWDSRGRPGPHGTGRPTAWDVIEKWDCELGFATTNRICETKKPGGSDVRALLFKYKEVKPASASNTPVGSAMRPLRCKNKCFKAVCELNTPVGSTVSRLLDKPKSVKAVSAKTRRQAAQ